MQKDFLNIVKIAKQTLDKLENGELYSSAYVVDRFNKAAETYPHDMLINNMRNVLHKKAAANEFMTQKQISEIYDQMVGIAGGQTAFRSCLGDLLPQKRQYSEKKASSSNLRANTGKEVSVDYLDKDLSDAFSMLFDLGSKNASVSSYTQQKGNPVQKMAIASLASFGHPPDSLEVVAENDHFVLCAAIYKDGINKVAVHIPMQVSEGTVLPPQTIIQGEDTIPFNKENLWLSIREARDNKKFASQNKFKKQRIGLEPVNIPKVVVPSGLEKYANLENELIAAASNYNTSDVLSAINIVSDELKSFGAFSPNVKIASSNETEMVLDAFIPTEKGTSVISVPVEFHNGKPLLPSKFASAVNNDSSEVIYDFSREGYSKFISDVKGNSRTIKIARQSGNLSTMSYHQLMDEMLQGVSAKNYDRAENALAIIQDKYDSSQFKAAFDKFSQLLKHSSSTEGSQREKFVKAAINKGLLIRHKTTVEWYCPKLGLPLSKIAFDDSGNPIPLRASRQDNANEEQVMISSYDIKFS